MDVVNGVRFFGTSGCCGQPLDASGFVFIELWSDVFCDAGRAGDQVKQYRRYWSESPLLSALSSLDMPCVSVLVCTWLYLPAFK